MGDVEYNFVSNYVVTSFLCPLSSSPYSLFSPLPLWVFLFSLSGSTDLSVGQTLLVLQTLAGGRTRLACPFLASLHQGSLPWCLLTFPCSWEGPFSTFLVLKKAPIYHSYLTGRPKMEDGNGFHYSFVSAPFYLLSLCNDFNGLCVTFSNCITFQLSHPWSKVINYSIQMPIGHL